MHVSVWLVPGDMCQECSSVVFRHQWTSMKMVCVCSLVVSVNRSGVAIYRGLREVTLKKWAVWLFSVCCHHCAFTLMNDMETESVTCASSGKWPFLTILLLYMTSSDIGAAACDFSQEVIRWLYSPLTELLVRTLGKVRNNYTVTA